MSGTGVDEADLAIEPRWTTEILVRFLAEELSRTRRTRLVVGVSGGLDSAVVAALAVRAVGAAHVRALHLPHRESDPASLADGRAVAASLGLTTETIDISPAVDALAAASPGLDRVRRGNFMARVRMSFLYDRSESCSGLVLGTSNKTELLLGYGTLHGDLASALNPIGDLYKTQVRALAEHLDVPDRVRAKPPSADLWAGQTDEDELGVDYATLDRLLALLVDARVGRAHVLRQGFAAELVDRIQERVVRTQFKRRPPVIAKVSTRTIGWDFRYPRDWKS